MNSRRTVGTDMVNRGMVSKSMVNKDTKGHRMLGIAPILLAADDYSLPPSPYVSLA